MISGVGGVNSNPPDDSVDGVCVGAVVFINGSGCGKLNSENGDVSNVVGCSTGGAFNPEPNVSSAGASGDI